MRERLCFEVRLDQPAKRDLSLQELTVVLQDQIEQRSLAAEQLDISNELKYQVLRELDEKIADTKVQIINMVSMM